MSYTVIPLGTSYQYPGMVTQQPGRYPMMVDPSSAYSSAVMPMPQVEPTQYVPTQPQPPNPSFTTYKPEKKGCCGRRMKDERELAEEEMRKEAKRMEKERKRMEKGKGCCGGCKKADMDERVDMDDMYQPQQPMQMVPAYPPSSSFMPAPMPTRMSGGMVAYRPNPEDPGRPRYPFPWPPRRVDTIPLSYPQGNVRMMGNMSQQFQYARPYPQQAYSAAQPMRYMMA